MSVMSFREPNEVLWRGVRPAHKGTQVLKSASAVNTTTIIHTVTAGKVLYLCFGSLSMNGSASGHGATLRIRDASDVTVADILVLAVGAGGHLSDSDSFYQPVEVPAGYDICVISNNAACAAYSAIFGWEE